MNTFFKVTFFPLLAIFLLVGCEATKSGKTQGQPPETQKQSSTTIEYQNDFKFDIRLSRTMWEGNNEITVIIPKDLEFSLNELPERIDHWLSEIKKNEGLVKAQAIPKDVPQKGEFRTRALIGIVIDIILTLLDAAREKLTYGIAENYNALLYYDGETGLAKKIIFYQK